MVTFLSLDELDSELEQVRSIASGSLGAERRAYNALSSEDFELLLYDIYQKSKLLSGWYDDVRLMIVGADQGRDVWLTCNEKPVGLIQCKRFKSAFTAPDTLREIIKFLLNVELDASLLPDSRRFQFILAVSSDPAGTTTDFFQTPQTWLGNHEEQLPDLIGSVIEKYENLSSLNVLSTLPRIKAYLKTMSYKLIRPVDLDGLLHTLPQVSSRFFNEKLVISIEENRSAVRGELVQVLNDVGIRVPLTPIPNLRALFASTSTIGRVWRQDIMGERLHNPLLQELLNAIDLKQQTILVSGLPGSGKTCLMLAVQEALELKTKTQLDLVPLFIQASEFADLATEQERQAHGLPQQWVENVARMAEEAHIVIVIDSLDVLSIARDHRVLKYFLAQVDRLLLTPNVTVVTACRDFDRRFDRRIAERKWDSEFKCGPLNWDSEIAPLLNKLSIDVTKIDLVTRELIRNPRELSLFVELAKRGGSFNVVTSQALAQRYINEIVKADRALGDAAVVAIESMANEMLHRRSFSIPQQRFSASKEVLRILLSHNVLHETQDGKLTFGHQTLLDVLVISAAVRSGVSLNDFIQSLSPVPFVRPSIRSFVAQLAIGERREFRQQLRTVLMGKSAFHIRRLVAESFSEQAPHDDDWPLLRDLRNQHRDVFQVIYIQAKSIEWHHFWLKHLVPVLKDGREGDGLTAHMHRVAMWQDDDPEGVIALWLDALSVDWIDRNRVANSISHSLANINVHNAAMLTRLIERLLYLPRQKYSSLGSAIAHCLNSGGADDQLLWQYIAGDICESDVLEYSLDGKLHCQSHEFGSNEEFLLKRMVQSHDLLNLAIQSIEEWSSIRMAAKGDWMTGRHGFLGHTTYAKAHSQNNVRHVGSEDILLGAIEASILHHGRTQSDWWQAHCERLCFSPENALRYAAILACTETPFANIGVTARMLRDKNLLQSDLSYEVGELIQTAFVYLNEEEQAAALSTILTMHEDLLEKNEDMPSWIWHARASLIVAVPCYLRSPATQALLDEYENFFGPLIRKAEIFSRGGIVRAPFSFEVFLNSSDISILGLLVHYNDPTQRSIDFLVGGAREVGCQLREAASRHPMRFLHFLCKHWIEISTKFRDDIFDGVANYLAHRYGDLQTNGTWIPVDEPAAFTLVQHVIDELERHPAHWHHNRAASNAVKACAHVIQSTPEAARLVFQAIGFANLVEESSITGDRVDLVFSGINMMRGHVAEALMIVVDQLQKNNAQMPELLLPALRRFAGDEHPAIRALILRRLPYLQGQNPELGWELYHLAMQGDTTGLWETAESCLYYAYRNDFARVELSLLRLRRDGSGKDLATWGRIASLAGLEDHIKFSDLLENLRTLNSGEAWSGAAAVWSHPKNLLQHREYCLAGIEAGLDPSNSYADAVARHMVDVFRSTTPLVSMPIELIRQYFSIFERDSENNSKDIFGICEWLNAISLLDPEQALAVAEIYFAFISRTKSYIYDHENSLTQLLTRFFAEAEEREETDHGKMLNRVVAVQDHLLSLGVEGVNEWLKAVERSSL